MFTATSLEAEYADFETQIYKKLAEIDEWNEFSATLEAANTPLSVVPEYPHTLVSKVMRSLRKSTEPSPTKPPTAEPCPLKSQAAQSGRGSPQRCPQDLHHGDQGDLLHRGS